MTGTTDREAAALAERELDEQLRALDDLDAEYEAGDLDRVDYETLRDQYQLRVADMMRRLETLESPSGEEPSGEETVTASEGGRIAAPAVGRRRRVGPVAVVVAAVFAAGAGWLLARSAGERGVGDALTGQIDSNRQRVFECQELGVDGQLIDALECFDEVLDRDPDNVQALTYRGWYVVLASSSAQAAEQDAEAAELLDVGRTYLDRAIEVDPSSPDAWAFRAVVYDRLGRSAEACADLAALVDLDPPAMFVGLTEPVAERNGC